MANRIKGITIEIGGDTTKLDKALGNVNSTISSTKAQLRDVEKLLKLDPKNTELLKQKQDLLNDSIKATEDKLKALKEASTQANKALEEGTMTKEQYNALQREIVATEQDLSKLKGQLNETKDSWVDWGSVAEKAGKVAKVAAEACAVAMVAVAGAITKVVKDSVEAYADFEQLVGGVETLFKDSASIVEEYANNAYMTAGLSANEYMETVTSFSASLIQSLNGDTAKSAQIADMAITDMSDNANKMGTDMSSLQNAYQGFAKQNYTMLDNLKLGYGGTKQEMERLLADAEELTGVKYDISNLSDVYEAIHAIQGELGITGTTAKEASTTIQGSVNSMKGAWQNLLVAFADGNADVGESVNNLVTTASTVLENILPVVEQALSGIVVAVKDLAPKIVEILPQLVEDILPNLLDAVMEMVQALADVAPDIIATLVTTLLDYLPDLVDCAVQLMVALIDGLSKMIPQLIPVALKAVTQLVDALIRNMPLLLEAAGKLLGAIVRGIIQNLPQITSSAKTIIKELSSAFSISNAIKWGADMISGFISGISSKMGALADKVKSVASTISSYLHFSVPDKGPLADFDKSMPDMIDLMVKGIDQNKYKLKDAVDGLATNMAQAPQNYNGILGQILTGVNNGSQIVLDTGELVGATAKAYNNEFGRIAMREGAR